MIRQTEMRGGLRHDTEAWTRGMPQSGGAYIVSSLEEGSVATLGGR